MATPTPLEYKALISSTFVMFSLLAARDIARTISAPAWSDHAIARCGARSYADIMQSLGPTTHKKGGS